MDWQKWATDAIERYIPDAELRRTVLAEIKGDRRPADRLPCPDHVTFRAVRESTPGRKMRGLYERAGPPTARGTAATARRPDRHSRRRARRSSATCRSSSPAWSALVAAVGADELGARMLTMYDPPPLVSGCSQAVLPGNAVLVRNYDYDPNLFDAVVLATRLADVQVIGTADQLWGLLDGINDRGLAVSFTFGGRSCRARGFSIPVVIRYLLETCTSVAEAVAALDASPCRPPTT